MLEIINHCYFSTGLYSGYSLKQEHQLTCVIKAGWHFDALGKLKRMHLAPAIAEIDCYLKEPGKSSLMTAHEIMPYKNGSEILLYGTVQPLPQSHVTVVSVTIEWPSQSTWQKKLYVFGPRKWQSMLWGFIPGKPEILEPLPLQYEFAYGGQDSQGKKNIYFSNPAGVGFTESRGIAGMSMPQIETPPFIRKISDQVMPAGFGPIPLAWQLPQQKSESPMMITAVAPSDQRFAQPFFGGEKIILHNLVANAPASKTLLLLPQTKPIVQLYLDEQWQEVKSLCDTVIIDSDAKILQMIWRAAIPWKVEDVREGVILIREVAIQHDAKTATNVQLRNEVKRKT